MHETYEGLLNLLVFTGGVAGMCAVLYLIAYMIKPNMPNPVKNSTYECGEDVVGEPHGQYSFQYMIYAILFLAFDVVSMFIFAWASSKSAISGSILLITLLFIGILSAASIYAINLIKEVKL